MQYSTLPDSETIHHWMEEKLTPEKVKERLLQQGMDAESIVLWMKAYRKTYDARNRFLAFLCMGGGALLGFISCMLSVFNPYPEMYGFFMYGLTSIAILIVFAGLYLLFE